MQKRQGGQWTISARKIGGSQALCFSNARGNVTQYGAESNYHASGYPLSITDPELAKTEFTYDDRGNVLQVKDNAGNEASTSQSGSQTQSAGPCGCAGDPIQVAKQAAETEQGSAALSAAVQDGASNDASPVRVSSPGSDGDVTQSNNAASSARSGNAASTTQTGSQTQGGATCGCAGKAIQVLGQEAETGQSSTALSGAFQLFGDRSRCGCDGSSSGNNASPVRVWSPGSDGDVTQSNNVASSATSGNRASTTQDASQAEAGGGLEIQALGQKAETGQEAFAASLAAQIGASNTANPVRVWSPGGGGSVDQSNNAASSAQAGNDARTDQSGRQLIAGSRCGCERPGNHQCQCWLAVRPGKRDQQGPGKAPAHREPELAVRRASRTGPSPSTGQRQVSPSVRLLPGVKQLLKSLPISRQRPARALANPPHDRVERAGEPDRHAVVLDELHVLRLRRSSAA